MSDKKQEEEVKDAPKGKSAEAAKEKVSAPKELKHKRIKVTHMTLDQVEHALEEAAKHMGSYHNSAYARSLVARKAALQSSSSVQMKRAA